MTRPIAPAARSTKSARGPRLRLEALESRDMLAATLSGFVFIDADSDGARETGDQGVPGAMISLAGAETGGASVTRSSLTLSDGSYSFGDLNPGTYEISENQPEPIMDGGDASAAAGATVGNDRIASVTLAANQTIAENNFGERGLLPQFVSLRMFLASTPPVETVLRETIANAEEAAGNTELADSIRAGGSQTPPVTNPNDAPVAAVDTYNVSENGSITIPAASGVLANDTDADGNSLTAQIVATADDGTLTLNADGSFTYTPDDDFTGVDTFTYQASDGTLTSAATVVTINVDEENDPPVATNDSYTVAEGATLSIPTASGVLANDDDPENATLTAQVVASPTRGALVLNANGSFTYSPNAGVTGTDTFTYRASDGEFTSNTATVTITINDTNRAPVAQGNSYNTNQGTPLTVNVATGVLSNDSDPDGDSITAQVVASPANGTLSLNANGSFTYTPNGSFSGTDSFTYRASDGSLTSATVTVTIAVAAVANTPFPAVTPGDFDDPGLLGIRTDLVTGAPPITATHVDGTIDYSNHSNPPTYGNHHGFDPNGTDVNPGITPRPTGVYTTAQPDEDLVHNLEHGHVWISYDPGLINATDLAALQQLLRDGAGNTTGGGVGVILTPRPANNTMIALASWAHLLELTSYNPATIRSFIETNRGKAPEGFITP